MGTLGRGENTNNWCTLGSNWRELFCFPAILSGFACGKTFEPTPKTTYGCLFGNDGERSEHREECCGKN
jgi:hypothetical protein